MQRSELFLEVTRRVDLVLTLALSLIALTPSSSNAQGRPDSVVTMTGQTRRVELPAGTSQFVVAPKIFELPVATLSQLLSGRFSGVQVVSNGATGTASRIRIRGQSSLFLGNDPLVVVDGVRLFRMPNSANAPLLSRLDDINVHDIENIEIIRGPSGTTLYGNEAANGVVNITTRRGARGKTQFRAYTENGLITDPNTYADLWSLWGKQAGSNTSAPCTFPLRSTSTCTADSLSHGNVMNIDSLTPIDRGFRNHYGAQLSGGSSHVQFFLSGEREDETGVFKMPARDIQQLKLERGVSSLPTNQLRPSALSRNRVRANISAQLASILSLQLSSAYISGDTRRVANDENAAGLSFTANGGQWRQDLRDADNVPLAGFRSHSAGDIMAQVSSQGIDRYINNVSAKFTPLRWFSVRAAYGMDDATQMGKDFTLRNEGPSIRPLRGGIAQHAREEFVVRTEDVGAAASFQPLTWLKTRTSVGLQRIRSENSTDVRAGAGLPVGSTNPADGPTRSESSSRIRTQTTALYAEVELSLNDKLFVNGGLRRETEALFGMRLDAVIYPAVGMSWLLSDQNFFPKRTWLNSVRMRAAYGAAGQFPGIEEGFDIRRFIAPRPLDDTATSSRMKPEFSAELELGTDVMLFGGASSIELSYYNKKTRDVFVTQFVPPGLGGGISSYEGNGGHVANRGFELAFTQRLVDRAQFSAGVALTGSTNKSRLTKLPVLAPPISTPTQRTMPGYPLFGFWGNTYTFADANNDGILTIGELTFSDSSQFIAPSFPTRELSLSPRVDLLNHKLRFAAQIDSKWGFRKYNNTLRHQCAFAISCRGINDRNAPLEMQAAAVAATEGHTLTGMFEDASFTRFREASVSYDLPVKWARSFRAMAWNVTLTGLNLGIITNYTGVDPEASVGTSDVRAEEYFSTPPMRYYTLRFNFTF